MYSWIWRHLPGNTPVRAVTAALVVASLVYLLMQYAFPWAEPRMPFSNVTVTQNDGGGSSTGGGGGGSPAPRGSASGSPSGRPSPSGSPSAAAHHSSSPSSTSSSGSGLGGAPRPHTLVVPLGSPVGHGTGRTSAAS